MSQHANALAKFRFHISPCDQRYERAQLARRRGLELDGSADPSAELKLDLKQEIVTWVTDHPSAGAGTHSGWWYNALKASLARVHLVHRLSQGAAKCEGWREDKCQLWQTDDNTLGGLIVRHEGDESLLVCENNSGYGAEECHRRGSQPVGRRETKVSGTRRKEEKWKGSWVMKLILLVTRQRSSTFFCSVSCVKLASQVEFRGRLYHPGW